jgi:hypothetical protein
MSCPIPQSKLASIAMTTQSEGWLIVQAEAGHCDILPAEQLPPQQREQAKTWGPYDSQGEATARRVGLIRSGQCKPV